MAKYYKIAELTRKELSDISSDALAILPLGATEQHGDHLNMSVDSYIIEAIVERTCEFINGEFPIYVAPVLVYGSSHHHRPFPTISLSSEVYLAVVKDILESLIKIGFKKIIMLNGHGGNDEVMRIATRDVVNEHDVSIGSASYWNLAKEKLEEVSAGRLGRVPGHAGGFETSLILALDDRLVKEGFNNALNVNVFNKDQHKLKLFVQRKDNRVGINGISDDPSTASKTVGEELLNTIVEEVSHEMKKFYQLTKG